MKIRVGIVGGAGYTAGELIRILINHPKVEIVFVQSESQAGEKVVSTHQDLIGETDLYFVATASLNSIDILFLCQGHGYAETFLQKHKLPDSLKIIDLGNDFRLKERAQTQGMSFLYGLPEWQREKIKKSQYIANPGCFATAIQLALLPLAKKGILTDDVHVQAITGSTGAGQQPTQTTHFSWRNNNVSAYKVFSHQHLGEIYQSIYDLMSDFDKKVHFVPLRGDFTRGIYTSIYTRCAISSQEEVAELFSSYYQSHPFVSISTEPINLKLVVNTNKAFLHPTLIGDMLYINSIIDNLVKGASGQAVQNMNLLFDIDETTGLNLKSVVF